jgi:hypothetical protein
MSNVRNLFLKKSVKKKNKTKKISQKNKDKKNKL